MSLKRLNFIEASAFRSQNINDVLLALFALTFDILLEMYPRYYAARRRVKTHNIPLMVRPIGYAVHFTHKAALPHDFFNDFFYLGFVTANFSRCPKSCVINFLNPRPIFFKTFLNLMQFFIVMYLVQKINEKRQNYLGKFLKITVIFL